MALNEKPQPPTNDDRDAKGMWKIAARYTALAMEVVFSVALCVYLGQWLDKRYDTTPYGFWIGVVIGVGAAIRSLVRMAKTVNFDKL